MAQTLFQNQTQVMVGLGTFTYTIPSTGIYSVILQSTEIPPSGIVIKVKDNGADVYTAPTLGVAQSAINFTYSQNYTSGHTVTIVLSSSNANDNQLNSVKTSASIQRGF